MSETHITPTVERVRQWMDEFVPPLALWFREDAPLPDSSVSPDVHPRSVLRTHPAIDSIEYTNAYHLWKIDSSATRFVIDDGRWIESLTDTDRAHVLEAQVRFRRGLVIDRERGAGFEEEMSRGLIGGHVVLWRALWEGVSSEARRQIVLAELSDWDDDVALPVPDNLPPHIASIANGYPEIEGMNCLSTTAYCLTAEESTLRQWLWQQEFHAILRAHGYVPVKTDDWRSGDVIVFQQDGQTIHAAYCLVDGSMLNKNGQSSFNPIKVIGAETLVAEWPECDVVVYRR